MQFYPRGQEAENLLASGRNAGGGLGGGGTKSYKKHNIIGRFSSPAGNDCVTVRSDGTDLHIFGSVHIQFSERW